VKCISCYLNNINVELDVSKKTVFTMVTMIHVSCASCGLHVMSTLATCGELHVEIPELDAASVNRWQHWLAENECESK